MIQTHFGEIYEHASYVCAIWNTGIFVEELLRFSTKSYCSDVCEYHQRRQTLAEICRNMDNCCGFKAVAARGNIRGSCYYQLDKFVNQILCAPIFHRYLNAFKFGSNDFSCRFADTRRISINKLVSVLQAKMLTLSRCYQVYSKLLNGWIMFWVMWPKLLKGSSIYWRCQKEGLSGCVKGLIHR